MNSFISVEKRRLASDSINPLELHHFWVLDDVSHFPTEHPPCPFAHRSRELRCLCHRVEQRCAHYCSLAFVEAANWHRRVGQKQPLVCGRGGACDKAAASVLRDCSAGAGLSRAVRCNNSKCVNSRTFHNRRAQRSSQDSEIGWYHGMKSIFSCVPVSCDARKTCHYMCVWGYKSSIWPFYYFPTVVAREVTYLLCSSEFKDSFKIRRLFLQQLLSCRFF